MDAVEPFKATTIKQKTIKANVQQLLLLPFVASWLHLQQMCQPLI